MKHIAARGPLVHIFKTGGVFTTESLGFRKLSGFSSRTGENTFANMYATKR